MGIDVAWNQRYVEYERAVCIVLRDEILRRDKSLLSTPRHVSSTHMLIYKLIVIESSYPTILRYTQHVWSGYGVAVLRDFEEPRESPKIH
jgi:hypothetical protein